MVIANIGDASLGCGPVWESFSFASMDQFNDLWDDSFGRPTRSLQHYEQSLRYGGQTAGETMGLIWPLE